MKNIEISAQVDAALPPVIIDRHKLTRTIVNLLSNAIKFTSPGGDVSIAAGRDDKGKSFLCSVSNSGEGIPATEFGRIFDKFGQIEMSKAGHTHSTGLGLTLCKLVVEAHGGRIWVESEMGVGSTFLFTIPIVCSN
jgi:signal transduction histidine kinase